jgi:hypothetical protein
MASQSFRFLRYEVGVANVDLLAVIRRNRKLAHSPAGLTEVSLVDSMDL